MEDCHNGQNVSTPNARIIEIKMPRVNHKAKRGDLARPVASYPPALRRCIKARAASRLESLQDWQRYVSDLRPQSRHSPNVRRMVRVRDILLACRVDM